MAVIEGLVVDLDTMYVIALVVLPPVGMDMLPMGGERGAKGSVHDRRPFLGTRHDARHDGFVKGYLELQGVAALGDASTVTVVTILSAP